MKAVLSFLSVLIYQRNTVNTEPGGDNTEKHQLRSRCDQKKHLFSTLAEINPNRGLKYKFWPSHCTIDLGLLIIINVLNIIHHGAEDGRERLTG